MQPEMEIVLSLLGDIHSEMVDTLQKAGPEGMNWQPGEGYNSLWVLAVHSAESQRFLIREILAGIKVQRDRDAEFAARGTDPAAVAALFAEVDELTRTTLAPLYPEDLLEFRPIRDHQRTKGWIAQYVVRHSALHLGHMQLTYQWWQERTSKG